MDGPAPMKVVRIRELATDRILWQSIPVTLQSSIDRLVNGALRNLDRDRCVVETVDFDPPKGKPDGEE